MESKYLFFDEDPFGRIVDVHWKQEDKCPPPRAARPHYCGQYGWGTVTTNILSPYGPNMFPPMIGLTDFTTDNWVGGINCGGVYSGNVPSTWNPIAIMQGYSATSSLDFLLGGITFTSNELWYGHGAGESEGPPPEASPHIFWYVPMSGGDSYIGCFGDGQNIFAPWVVQTLTFNISWSTPSQVGNPGMLGLGFARWIDVPGRAPGETYPPEPQYIMGDAPGGNFTLTYVMNAWEWWTTEITRGHHYTWQSQWDLSTGGPVQLWFYWGMPGAWFPGRSMDVQVIYGSFLNPPGSILQWEVVADCALAFTAADLGPASSRPPQPPPLPGAGARRPGSLIRPRSSLIWPANPALCSESTNLVYPALDPTMLDCIGAFERELATPMLRGRNSRRGRP